MFYCRSELTAFSCKETERVAGLLGEVTNYLNSVNKEAREEIVDDKLAALVRTYADELKLEKRGSVKLDKQELTLNFSIGAGSKKEFLWAVGSGETGWGTVEAANRKVPTRD
jgi:hypothetical protein